MVDAAGSEAALRDLETTSLSQQHVLERHADVLEEDLHVALGSVVLAEGQHRPQQGDAWRVHRHEQLRLLLVDRTIRPGLTHEDHDLAVQRARARAPPLGTVDHVLAARLVPGDRDANVGRIARGDGGFRHGEARADAPLEQRQQPAPPLLRVGVPREHLHVARVGARAVARHRGELGVAARAHDLADLGVLPVRQPAANDTLVDASDRRRVHRQEEVPQALRLRLC